ncbi:MAG TPA: methyltransferase domain-containing protein [Candidatus Brocadiia bacterium]|nr:methyltransferase domain-containing protein [Candidatus Brocadiia bacterium]
MFGRKGRREELSLPTRGRVLTHAASVYDALIPIVAFGAEPRLNRMIADALAPKDGDRIVDVGCGTGLLTAEVSARIGTGEVIGVDASFPMIKVASRKRANSVCRFQPGLAEELPFEDSSFDAYTSALFYHHVPLDLKKRSAMEAMRVLKPGGRFVIADIDRPWTLFGKLYSYSGVILLRQPEIEESIKGVLQGALLEAGAQNLAQCGGTMGCIRLLKGNKAK